jgi:putative FmdB family regulatory protein
MAIYEYKCKKCGRLTEVFQKITDPPIKKCEFCGGKLIKLISKNSFILLGNGWFKTDYKDKPNPNKKGK